jgi:hypothetical protein
MRPLHDQLIACNFYFNLKIAFNKNFMEEISRINLRPLRQTPENLPLHWIARESTDGNFGLKSTKFTNHQSLLDIRKSGVSSDKNHPHTSVELERFSDFKRQSALNLLLLESSGWDTGDAEEKQVLNVRSSVGNESVLTSELDLVEEIPSSDGSSPMSKEKFGKKLLKFITPKKSSLK